MSNLSPVSHRSASARPSLSTVNRLTPPSDGGGGGADAARQTIYNALMAKLSQLAVENQRADKSSAELTREFEQRHNILRNVAGHVRTLRAQLNELECIFENELSCLLSRERAALADQQKAFETHEHIEQMLTHLEATGTDAERAAIAATFRRTPGTGPLAPYKLPPASRTMTVGELRDEFFNVKSSSATIVVPPESTSRVRCPFTNFDTPYALKLTRLFRVAGRPDVMQFILLSPALEKNGRAAHMFAVALKPDVVKSAERLDAEDDDDNDTTSLSPRRRRSFEVEIDAWFSLPSLSTPKYPSSNSDVYRLTLASCNIGNYDFTYSSADQIDFNAQIRAGLFDIEKQVRSAPICVFPDWQNDAQRWQCKLPLEYGETSQHRAGDCWLSCTALAVRQRWSPNRTASFACLCWHEPTNQVFWQAFDPRDIAALRVVDATGEARQISECDCLVPSNYLDLASPTTTSQENRLRLASVPESPFKTLSRSMHIERDVANNFAAIDNVAQRFATDPSTIMHEALERNDAGSIQSVIPRIGFSIVVQNAPGVAGAVSLVSLPPAQLPAQQPLLPPQTSQVPRPVKHANGAPSLPTSPTAQQDAKRKHVEDNDDDDGDGDAVDNRPAFAHPIAANRPKNNKKKRHIVRPAGFLTAKTASGKVKTVHSCSKCGIEGVKAATHGLYNHGCRTTFDQEKLRMWRDSMIADGVDWTKYLDEAK